MRKLRSFGNRSKAHHLLNRSRTGKPAGRGDRRLHFELLEQRQLLSAGGNEQLTNLFGFESDVAVDPNDPLIVATSQFQTVLISRDGGRTFPTTVNLNAPAPYINTFGGDPTLSFDSQGNLYFGYLSNNSAPVNPAFPIGVFAAVINPQTGAVVQNTQIAAEALTFDNDKEWVAADHWGDSPFRDNAYMVWSQGNNGVGGNDDQIMFSRTTNGGGAWSAAVPLNPGGQGFVWPSEVSVARNGDVWVAWHTNTGNAAGNLGGIAMRRSSDGGVTFQPQVTPFTAGTADITDNTPPNPLMPGNRSWMQGAVQPRILLDPIRPNNIYVIAVDDPDNNYAAGDPAVIVMARSTDYGASWTRTTISHGPFGTIQTMPSAAIDEEGNISVMWYDSRNGRPSVGVDQIPGNADDNLLLDLYATVSLDGGLTWSNDFQVNENAFDPDLGPPTDRWPPNNIFRIGEYNGQDADSGYSYVSWTANNGNNQDISFDVFSALSAFPDQFEENDTLETATFLGSNAVIQQNGLTIHPGDSADDEDFFIYSAHTTGKLLVHVDFLDRAGNLDLQIQDTLGNEIILANSTDDDETVDIPVVSGEEYVIRVFGVGGNTNHYDLEIENFAAPIPTGGFLDPASDSGRSDADNVTNDDQPQMFIFADVLNFVDTNHNDTRDANEIAALTAAQATGGTTAGAAVEAWLTNTTTWTTVKGYANPLDANNPVLYSFTPGAALADGVYVVMAATRVFDGQRDAGGSPSPADGRTPLSVPLLQFTVDTQAPPVNILDIDPASTDTGVDGFPATFTDRITSDTATGFYGRAEADAIVRLYVDDVRNDAIDTPTQFSLTVAVPLDGDEQFPDGQWSTSYIYDLNAPLFAWDGVREVLVRAEDVAGNVSVLGADDILDIFIDTQGPRVYDPPGAAQAIQIAGYPDFNLFDPKEAGANPDAGPTPLVNSLVINVEDLPNRATDFLYDALVAGGPTLNLGNYLVEGDHNGVIPIQSVAFNPNALVVGQPATGTIDITFFEPLPDDRYTLTISDGLVDSAGNRLDGENNAIEPQDPPFFPTGDGVPGGDFAARFTVDSRPEIGVWGAGNVWVDTNGNFVFDPDNPDFTNRDIVYAYSQDGFTSDEVLAGKFAARGPDGILGTADDVADGFDTLAVYGSVFGQYRWHIDTNNNGVLDFQIDDPANINGFPVAGNFDADLATGDEVGLYTGNTWWFDTTRDFNVNASLTSALIGYPIVGDFDGDGLDDLGAWANDQFQFDLSGVGATAIAGLPGLDGSVEAVINFGFIGVRERPVAADFDGDGIDDIGLWVPDRPGAVPEETAEWYLLISNDHAGTERVFGQVNTLDHRFEPIPFGKDIFAQYGDEFAPPVVGNFDPPVTSGSAAEVVDRHIFYDNSNWDDPLQGRDNDDAIAPGKTALLPGETATFENYTSYDKGINGIMVDIADPDGTITAADFEFKVGNDNQPGGWSPVTVTPIVEVRPGQGTGNSDRVTIIWPDHTIQNEWLQVVVLADNIGLEGDDVFYFGNAIGESGNSTADAKVTIQDILGTVANPHLFWNPAPIESNYDYNRDERVDTTDVLIARANQTWSMTALKLIDFSGSKAGGGEASAYDVVMKQSVEQRSDSRVTSSAKMTWLHEFERPDMRQQSSESEDSVRKAVDKLLAIDSPSAVRRT